MSQTKPINININLIPCEFCGNSFDKNYFIEHNKSCDFKYNNSFDSYNYKNKNKKNKNILEKYISHSYQIKGNSLKKFLKDNEYYDYEDHFEFDFNSDDEISKNINNDIYLSNKSNLDNFSVLHNLVETNQECPICLEHFEENSKVRTTICFHTFCISCINKWFNNNNFCPICKEKIK